MGLRRGVGKGKVRDRGRRRGRGGEGGREGGGEGREGRSVEEQADMYIHMFSGVHWTRYLPRVFSLKLMKLLACSSSEE